MEDSTTKGKFTTALVLIGIFLVLLFAINKYEEIQRDSQSLHLLSFKPVVEKELIDGNLKQEKIILFENDKYRIVKFNNQISIIFEKRKQTDYAASISLTVDIVNDKPVWTCHKEGFSIEKDCSL